MGNFRMTESAFKRGMAAAWTICALMGATSATAQQTIRVGWTIPAEESKYWMMKRPAEFPELGKTYNIEVKNPRGISKGVREMLVNGKAISGNVIPLSAAGESVNVVVELG